MFRKSLMTFVFVGLALAVTAVTSTAQNAPVSGTVEMTKADGTRVPVEGALIEVYRQDVKATSPPAKTGKKGEFTFAGLQIGQTFILSVSAPGARPTYLPNVKPGQERLLILMSPGDGNRVSEEEVRAAVAAPPASEADAKKAAAEFEAKKKEVEEKNKKAEATNQIIMAALKAGNDAFTAKNYDVAIVEYDKGIAADPMYVGSAPIFHNNRGIVLRQRGVDSYNLGIKAADVSEKIAYFGKAKKDFADASAGYLLSWNVLKNAAAADIGENRTNYENNKMGTLRGSIDTFQMAVRTEQVDPAVIDAAKMLIPEYLAVEPDATKKAQANLALADLYRVVGDSENAIAAYKAILETAPDNPDALVGAGLSLVNLGYMNNDKTKLQEGANLLQKFAGIAPDTNKFKADALALIDTLKKEQNVTPQKATTPAKKKN
jgi:tetratricopeptide (TPR) repeat protein